MCMETSRKASGVQKKEADESIEIIEVPPGSGSPKTIEIIEETPVTTVGP